jgi:hypothetical protein
MSKRERQKQRREARLQQERAADKRARQLRILALAAVGVIFAGLVGVAVARNRAESARLAEQTAAVQERLDELGCTPAEEQEDRGQGHLNAAQLAESPPEALYPDRPATSGEHFQGWLKTGVYDQVMDERILIHNLEHGYVNAFYADGADAAQIDEFKSFAQEQIDGNYPKLIVSPWDGELPEDYNFAFTAWGVRQMCSEFDTDTMTVFLREYHSSAGNAPEKTLPAHLEEGNGTIDPGDEPFLLPPLGNEALPTEGMDEEGNIVDPETQASEEPGATEAP